MRRSSKVLAVYLISLIMVSLIFSFMGIQSFEWNLAGELVETRYMLIVTILGGLIALYQVVTVVSFRIFVTVYIALWLFRFLIYYLVFKVGQIHLLGRDFNLHIIVPSYYSTVSRLETPLPFIIYWFVNYVVTILPGLTNRYKKAQDGVSEE